MAVVIRMKRAGAKKRPFYRVVVANSRSPRDGRYIEQLGYYDPLTDPATFQIDAARFTEWVRRGAIPSESVGVMVSKHIPAELRAPAVSQPVPVGEPAAVKPKKTAPAKSKSAKPKSTPKRRAATKGSAKKAMTRAKAKAKTANGAAKTNAASKKAKN